MNADKAGSSGGGGGGVQDTPSKQANPAHPAAAAAAGESIELRSEKAAWSGGVPTTDDGAGDADGSVSADSGRRQRVNSTYMCPMHTYISSVIAEE